MHLAVIRVIDVIVMPKTVRPSLPYSKQPYTVERPFVPVVRRIRKAVAK